MLRDTKDLAEKLKGKILKMTKSLSNSEVMSQTETEKETLNSENYKEKNEDIKD